MKKLIKYLFFGSISAIIIVALSLYYTRKTRVIPYPYLIQEKLKNSPELQSSEILLVGDQMSSHLKRFIPLGPKVRFYDWSSENEGLHRTLYKLKTLKRWPKIIIYHGAASEFFEKKFYISHKDTILKNFKLYSNTNISSLIQAFPIFSRFFYQKEKRILLKKKKKDKSDYSSTSKQLQMETAFHLYKYELEQLVSLARKNNSTLIFITTPINLMLPPGRTCENSFSPTLEKMQIKIEEHLAHNQTKEAYHLASQVKEQALSNAKVYYQLGFSAYKLSKFPEARENLNKARAFDCETKYPTPIFNSIQLGLANQYSEVILIDFNKMISRAFGKNEIFLDKIYPQSLYYERLGEKIRRELGKIISNKREFFYE